MAKLVWWLPARQWQFPLLCSPLRGSSHAHLAHYDTNLIQENSAPQSRAGSEYIGCDTSVIECGSAHDNLAIDGSTLTPKPPPNAAIQQRAGVVKHLQQCL
jgi:hypothetical protein